MNVGNFSCMQPKKVAAKLLHQVQKQKYENSIASILVAIIDIDVHVQLLRSSGWHF
jgi:hypothetical protein